MRSKKNCLMFGIFLKLCLCVHRAVNNEGWWQGTIRLTVLKPCAEWQDHHFSDNRWLHSLIPPSFCCPCPVCFRQTLVVGPMSPKSVLPYFCLLGTLGGCGHFLSFPPGCRLLNRLFLLNHWSDSVLKYSLPTWSLDPSWPPFSCSAQVSSVDGDKSRPEVPPQKSPSGHEVSPWRLCEDPQGTFCLHVGWSVLDDGGGCLASLWSSLLGGGPRRNPLRGNLGPPLPSEEPWHLLRVRVVPPAGWWRPVAAKGWAPLTVTFAPSGNTLLPPVAPETTDQLTRPLTTGWRQERRQQASEPANCGASTPERRPDQP